MIVLPDTNQFHGDPRMCQRLFRILLGAHHRGDLRLAIPEAVLRELPKLYGNQVEGQLKVLDDAVKRLDYLVDRAVELTSPPRDIDAARRAYEEEIRRLLAGYGVLTPEIRERPVSELFDRSVSERRPFRDKGRGFRDAVIWDSVLELASEDVVVLVTKNHRDFAESAGSPDVLHPHLVADLEDRGLPADRVRLAPTLERFVERYLPQNDRYLHQATSRLLGGGDAMIAFRERLDDELSRFTIEHWDRVSLLDSRNAKAENVVVFDVDDIRPVIAEAHDIDEEPEISLLVEVTANFQFLFTVTEAEAQWLIEEDADVEFDEWRDGFVQGTTGPTPIKVVYAIGFDVEAGALVGDFERIAAFNATEPLADRPGDPARSEDLRPEDRGPRRR